MIAVSVLLLGVMLLANPDDDGVGRELAARISAEADTGVRPVRTPADGPKGAKITAGRSDFDREEGVVMFDRDVCVEYAQDYVLRADRLFVFLDGSNTLSRIVAIGSVAITNDLRVGSCAMAKFWKRTSEIEMYGDGTNSWARLTDASGANDLQGARIRFWIDSEQVEVERPRIQVEQKGGGGFL